MFTFERKLLCFIEKHLNIMFFVSAGILGALIRYVGRDYISADMSCCLIPWFNDFKSHGGLNYLGVQTGDYNILYQTIIAFMSYLDGNCVYYFKLLSVAFDYLLAFYAAKFACALKGGKTFDMHFNIVYAVVLFLPTVIFNSAYWGQCDAIYTFFVILTLLYLFKEKYTRAFVFLGIAFAFKLQTVFILPFILCYYFYKRNFSIAYFGISVAVFWLSSSVAFFFGRSVTAPFTIYFQQTGLYKNMYINVSSFWVIAGSDYNYLNKFAILLTIMICGLGLFLILSSKKKFETPIYFISVAAWFTWACVLFLPAMHERYTYLSDILLLIAAFIDKKNIKYAVVSEILSLITYSVFLWGNELVDRWFVIAYLLLFIKFTVEIFQNKKATDLALR